MIIALYECICTFIRFIWYIFKMIICFVIDFDSFAKCTRMISREINGWDDFLSILIGGFMTIVIVSVIHLFIKAWHEVEKDEKDEILVEENK